MAAPETLKIDEVEYVRKDSIQVQKRKEGIFEIGESYFIQSVTHYYHGTLIGVETISGQSVLVINNAVQIPDCGPFHDFITGKTEPTEIEPFSPEQEVFINIGSLVICTKHKTKKYSKQK